MKAHLHYHARVAIVALLRNYHDHPILFMKQDDGTPMSDQTARTEIAARVEQGHKYLPVGGACPNFDTTNGCPGHLVGFTFEPFLTGVSDQAENRRRNLADWLGVRYRDKQAVIDAIEQLWNE